MNQIGKYKIIKELGSGGFGAVYLAEDPKLGMQVAIKVFNVRDENVAGLATSASTDAAGVLKERFIAEAKTLHQLSSNPYIVNIKEYDELEDGTPYYVMPYLPKSLENEIGKDAFTRGKLEETPKHLHPRKLPLGQSIEILKQILEALSAVHRAGLVHRDVKPANILFDDSGNVQLCDFGIAKVTDSEHSQSGVGMGSRNYMSPEQRESAKHVSPASDIYSTGVLAYRMLTGQLPVGKYQDVIEFVPQAGKALSDLIDKAISQREQERPKDGAAFLSSLIKAQRGSEEIGNDSDDTATDVELSNQQSIKAELKPLETKIIELLEKQGEITEKDKSLLLALADLANVDEAGLQALITQVKEKLGSQNPQTKAFITWVDKLNLRIEKGETSLAKEALETIVAAGAHSTGREEATLKQIVLNKGFSCEQQPIEQVEDVSPKKSNISILLIVAVLLIGGGFFGFQQYQQFKSEQAEAAFKQQDLADWQSANGQNTILGYQEYLQTQPNGHYRKQVQQSIADIEAKQLAEEKAAKEKQLAQQKAAQLKAQQEKARTEKIGQTKTAQSFLKLLGYQVSQTGELDTRTQKAIQDFEQKQKLTVTGSVDIVLIANLEKAVKLKEHKAWQTAVDKNTLASFKAYLNEYPKGKFAKQAQSEIKTINNVIAEKEKALAVARQRELAKQKEIESAWLSAKAANNQAKVQQFVSKYPDSKFDAQAKQLIKALTPLGSLNKYFNKLQTSPFKGEMTSDGVKKLAIELVAAEVNVKESTNENIKLSAKPNARGVRIAKSGSILVIDYDKGYQNTGWAKNKLMPTLIDIEIPSFLDVDIEVVNGEINSKLLVFDGSARVINGDIALEAENVDGKIETVNGDISISANAITGDFESVNGKIEVAANTPAGSVSIKSVSGSLELSLNSSASIDLEATTLSGKIRNRLTSDKPVKAKYGNSYSLDAFTHDARHRIKLETINGNVDVKQK